MKKIFYLMFIFVLSSCASNELANYDSMIVEEVAVVPDNPEVRPVKIMRIIRKAPVLNEETFLTPEGAVELIKTINLTDKRGNAVANDTFDAEFFSAHNLKSHTNAGKIRFFTFPYSNGEYVIVFPKFLFSDTSFRKILNRSDFDIAIPYPFDLNSKIPTIDHFNEYATNDDKAELLKFLFGKIMTVEYLPNENKPFVRMSTSKYKGGSVDIMLLDKSGNPVPVNQIIKSAIKDTVKGLNYFQRNLLKVATIGKNSKLNKFAISVPKAKIKNYK